MGYDRTRQCRLFSGNNGDIGRVGWSGEGSIVSCVLLREVRDVLMCDWFGRRSLGKSCWQECCQSAWWDRAEEET